MQTVIYGDILLAVNWIVDYFLLVGVAALTGCGADGKASLSTANLQTKGTGLGERKLGIFPQNGGIGDQKMGTGGNSFRSVLLFSHSHLAICSLIW